MPTTSSRFLNNLWDLNNSLIEERLDEQAVAIGVSRELLLNRHANGSRFRKNHSRGLKLNRRPANPVPSAAY